MLMGQIISVFGSSLLRFGFSLYVLDLTGREDIFGLLLAVSYAPLLLAPIGGVIADRVNRRNLIVLLDFFSVVLALVFIVFLTLGEMSIILIGCIMFLFGVVGAMVQPTVNASVPVLVMKEKLEQANSMVSGVGAVAAMLAPITGAVLYGMLGMQLLTTLCCIAFFIAGVTAIFIKMPYQRRSFGLSIIDSTFCDLKEGFSYVIRKTLIFKVMLLAAILNLLVTPFFIVGAPIVLYKIMKSSNTMFGLGMGLFELATILGAISIGLFSEKLSINGLYKWIGAIAVLFVLMAISLLPGMLTQGFYGSFVMYFAGALPVTMILTMISIYVITVIQKLTPNELLGKVMANIMAVSQCAAPIGQVIYGFLFKQGAGSAYLMTLLLSVCMFVVAVGVKWIMRREEGI